jgi:hypothetical protein
MTYNRSREWAKIAGVVDDNIPNLVDSRMVEIELDLADYLKDYMVEDFGHLVDYMDDCMHQCNQMVLSQLVINAADDSTYNFDQVTIYDECCRSAVIASVHHIDLVILNVANSAVIADNNCCSWWYLQLVAVVARNLNEVNKADCMMVNYNKMMFQVEVAGVGFDCACCLPQNLKDGRCNENYTWTDYGATVMVVDNEMKGLVELFDAVAKVQE